MNKYLDATIRLFGTPRWVVLKNWRKKRLNQIFPNGRVSPNFRHVEFWTKDGTPIPTRAVPALRWLCKYILEPMREEFGPYTCTSGYRHYWYNRRIGGVPNSEHVWDDDPNEIAVDGVFARGTPAEWATSAAKKLRATGRGGGIGVYEQDNAWFIHIDTRLHRARWFGSKTRERRMDW